MGKKNKKRRNRAKASYPERSERGELIEKRSSSQELTSSLDQVSSYMRDVVLRIVIYSVLVLVCLGVLEFRKKLLEQVLHEGAAFREPLVAPPFRSLSLDGQRYTLLDNRDEIRSQLVGVVLGAVENLRMSGFSYQHELGKDVQIVVQAGLSSRARIHYNAVIDEVQDLMDEGSEGCDGLVKLREEYEASTILVKEEFLSDEQGDHSLVLSHELFHLVSGLMPNRLWMEGLAELFEDGCSEFGKQRRGTVEGLILSEEVAYALQNLNLHKRPFNNLNMYDSLFVSEDADGALQMSRYAAFFAWKTFVADHPDFLVRFVEAFRKEVGTPQLLLPSEKALIRIANSVVPGSESEPSFADWYESQPAFKQPAMGDTLFGGSVKRNSEGNPAIELISGVWFKRTPLPGEKHLSHRLVSVDLVVLPPGGYEEVLSAPGKMMFELPFQNFEYLDVKQRVEGAKYVRFYAKDFD